MVFTDRTAGLKISHREEEWTSRKVKQNTFEMGEVDTNFFQQKRWTPIVWDVAVRGEWPSAATSIQWSRLLLAWDTGKDVSREKKVLKQFQTWFVLYTYFHIFFPWDVFVHVSLRWWDIETSVEMDTCKSCQGCADLGVQPNSFPVPWQNDPIGNWLRPSLMDRLNRRVGLIDYDTSVWKWWLMWVIIGDRYGKIVAPLA